MNTISDPWDRPAAGRHAFDEDAVLTPIFHALARGPWRNRQRDAVAVEHFRRDPLTAPIPIQTIETASGRHHRRAPGRRDRLATPA